MPRTSTTPAAKDPDALQRQQAGTYRTADERFEVRQADQGWFLVDSQRTDDLGQALVRGPFPTLKAVREAIPEARSAKVVSLPRRAAAKAGAKGRATKQANTPKRAPEPPPAPESWIDRLPSDERAHVRRVVRALEAEGVTDAEQLVRRDRDGLMPAVATRLIEARLAAVLAEASPKERELVARAVAVITGDGHRLPAPLPGWSVVEIGTEPAPPNRRITL